MRRTAIVFVLLALWSACDDPPPPPAPPTEPPEWVKEAVERSQQQAETAQEPARREVDLVVEKPLLWRVEAPEGAISHLLGSFHVGTDFHGVDALPPSVRSAFEASDTIVLEADTGLADPGPITEFIVLPEGKSLRAMLKPKQWEVLVKETGLPPEQLDRTAPWVVSGQLTHAWIPDAGIRGMDDRFRILARAYEKKLVFLETLPQQAKILSRYSTAPMLQEALEEVDEGKIQIRKALADFRRGDAEALHAWAFEPEAMKAHPRFYEAVFFERNASWAELLAEHLDAGNVLVVVGAGHLLGKRSLVELLDAKGYEVRRVE